MSELDEHEQLKLITAKHIGKGAILDLPEKESHKSITRS